MAIKPILTVPNTKLNTKCEQITEINDEIKQLGKDLLETLLSQKDPEGAGLAAPQIGVLKRICAVRRFIYDKENYETSSSKEYLLINPEIVKTSTEKEIYWEACLSIPNTYAQVERPKKIKVEALDIEGNKIRINTSGFFARVIQHEMDHLDGILITDKNIGKTITEEEFDKLLHEKSL